MPEDIQKAVLEAGAEVSKMTLERAEAEDAKGLEEAKKTMEIYHLEKPWKKAWKGGLEEWRKRTGAKKAEEIMGLLPK